MTLIELIQIPDERRDPQWEADFFMQLSQSNLNLVSEEAKAGPDGWPYLLAETSPDASEPAQKIIQWLATRGLGLAINPQKEYPDYVFTYGMIWHFKETGLFFRARPEVSGGSFSLVQGELLHAGPPSFEYLPQYVRNILKQFFMDQGLLGVKILVMSADRINYDLAFSLESLGNPPTSEHQGIAEAISWFLPPHYSIALVSEKGLPAFVNL